MAIDRLIGILAILLREEKATAAQLAARLEVDQRTIYRDMERLCRAGSSPCGPAGEKTAAFP